MTAAAYRYLLDTNIVSDLVHEPRGAAGLRLVTRNAGEFTRVPGLEVTSWPASRRSRRS